jgi:hypothetical protein
MTYNYYIISVSPLLDNSTLEKHQFDTDNSDDMLEIAEYYLEYSDFDIAIRQYLYEAVILELEQTFVQAIILSENQLNNLKRILP